MYESLQSKEGGSSISGENPINFLIASKSGKAFTLVEKFTDVLHKVKCVLSLILPLEDTLTPSFPLKQTTRIE